MTNREYNIYDLSETKSMLVLCKFINLLLLASEGCFYWTKGAFTWTLQSGLNAHSIRFVSVHMNLLLLDANSMRIAFNPPPEVD